MSVLLAGAASLSCAHAPGPCPTPEPVRVSIRAAGRLNPSESGESLATTVRLYQLKDVSKLQAASLDLVGVPASEITVLNQNQMIPLAGVYA